MDPSHHDALSRWLEAERDGLSDEADEALLELFEALPLLAPPRGFADRVLAAGLPVAMALPLPGLFARRWVQVAVALCLAATGVSVLWLPQTLRALAGTWSFGGLVEAGVDLLAHAGVWLGSAFRVGGWLFALGRALALPLATPQVVAALAGCLVVSILAFRFLHELISRERSWTYVDPI